MKPISASDILRRNAPRELLGRSFAHINRFDNLRDISPAPSGRSHLGSFSSVKRKDEDIDEPETISVKKGKTIDLTEEDEMSIALLESNAQKVSTLFAKITMDIQESDLCNQSKSILSDLASAVRTLAENQKVIITKLSTPTVIYETEVASKKSYSSALQKESTSAMPPPPPLGTLVASHRADLFT
jgi:hypothetical protein